MKISFIGLGRMGWHMAGHLADRGHELTVYDPSDRATKTWASRFSGTVSATLASACANAEVVLTALPADAQLQQVWDTCLEYLAPGTIWVDHSTTSAQIARELSAKGKAQLVSFMDAPVSGGTVGAEKGSLTIMGGGDETAWLKIQPIIECYASKTTWLGSSGAGQLTKMANQICVAGIGQALAEGLAFAEREGLDTKQVLEVMRKGSSTSWMMENRSEAMLNSEYNFGFSSTLMKKDLGLVLQEAQQLGMPLPVTEIVAQLLDQLSTVADPSWDWCSLMEQQRQAHQKNEP
jgi:3-hydroxyisobutyrate dehydrogenase|uniref:NAD(P)-dependent oxidoreductase n=1 Tax=Orrella sp. TaxID=1921583 RepID=UPI004047A18E